MQIKPVTYKKGSITVFLCFILSACIAVTGILCDSLRVKASSAKISRNVISAGNSVLALYNSILKDQYGLFALSVTDKEDAASIFDYYLENNLASNKDLFNLNIESISVTPIYNLTENEVVKSQILENMKYKAPELLGEDIIKKIKLLKDGSKVSDSIIQKNELERKLYDEIPSLKDFTELLNSKVSEFAVNKFDINIITQLVKEKSVEEAKRIINGFKDANQNSINKLNSIIEKSQDIISKADGITKNLMNIKDSVESFSDGELSLSNTLSNSLGSLSDIFGTTGQAGSILKELAGNISYLDKINVLLESGKTNEIVDLLQNNNGYNNNILVDVNNNDSSEKSDPRNLSIDKAKDFIDESSNDSDIKISNTNIKIDDLPSRKKVITPDFTTLDNDFINNSSNNTSYDTSVSDMADDEYTGLENLSKQIEFSEGNDKGFSTNALSFFSSISDIIGDLSNPAENFRNNLYINEYVLDKFNFNGNDKNNNSFFKNEVEYILQGNDSQKKNLSMTKNEILIIRFILNIIHIYSDPNKVAAANEAAASISSWWSLGIAVPVISTLIICAWSMIESTIDTKDLMEGKSVPFYKLKSEWKTSIDGSLSNLSEESGSSEGTNKNIKFNYKDYLRILLLLRSSNKKLDRIEDLIELNLQQKMPGLKLSSCSTELRIEGRFSMNYLFLTQAVIPKKYRIGNRQLLKNLRYVGYL